MFREIAGRAAMADDDRGCAWGVPVGERLAGAPGEYEQKRRPRENMQLEGLVHVRTPFKWCGDSRRRTRLR
jgi:hypothetical protein